MPAFENTLQDDPLTYDACESFVGGQQSFNRSNRLQLTEAAELLNLDMRRDGLLLTRRGTANVGAVLNAGKRVQGLSFYSKPGTDRVIAAINGGLMQWDGSSWAALAGYAAADAARDVAFAQGIDRLYMTDGSGNVHQWDGTTMTNLGTGGGTQPPVCRILQWHTSRLFAAGVPSIPDALYASNILDGATWNTTSLQVRVGAGDGDGITGLATWIDYDMVVGKRNSLWIVNTNPASTGLVAGAAISASGWQVTQVHRRIGCVSARSMIQVGQDVWFLSDTGIRSVRRTIATDQNEISEAISHPVQDIIDRINWSQASKAAAVFWDNRYVISLPLDSASNPNYLLVYNTLTASWSGLWTGWDALVFAPTSMSGSQRLMFGRTDGYVREWLDYVAGASEVDATFQDAGTAIATRLRTRAMIFNEAINEKKGYNLDLEFLGSSALADLAIVRDSDDPETIAQQARTSPLGVRLPVALNFTLPRQGVYRRVFDLLQYDPFRELQVKLTTTGGKLALRQITASAFIDSLDIER